MAYRYAGQFAQHRFQGPFPLATRPELILEVLSSERANVRDEISTMPPLTTLTQWGVAYAIVYAIRRGAGRTAA